MRLALALLALAACGDASLSPDGPDAGVNDAGPGADAPPCETFIEFDPPMATAGPSERIRAIAHVPNASGVPTYNWTVYFGAATNVPFELAQQDGSEITFPAAQAGFYGVTLTVDAQGAFCTSATNTINVFGPGEITSYRLAVRAPNAPPQEKTLAYPNAQLGYAFGDFNVDPGLTAAGAVQTSTGTRVASYLRFIPRTRPDQYVEAFTDTTGGFSTKLLDEVHDVLVVPLASAHAPRLVANYTPQNTLLAVGAGTLATGTIYGPSGAALAGTSSVQLTIDGIPSTLHTGAASFSVAYEPKPGARIQIEVTPPASSGLPKLVAASDTLDPTQPIEVRYAAALATRDLAGTVFRRGGTPLAGADIHVVGSIGAAASVTTGAVTISAIGTTRTQATTAADGSIPTLRVPHAPLSVVIALDPDDTAQLALHDFAAPLASPVAVPVVAATPLQLLDPAGAPVDGAHVTLVPRGALELANLPPIELVSTATGDVSLPFAANGRYELRVFDPEHRGAPFATTTDVTSATAPASVMLPRATVVTGTVKQSGSPNPVANASVQVLCKSCIGVDRTRPIAHTASAPSGNFSLAVP